jgi:hypothetical protein
VIIRHKNRKIGFLKREFLFDGLRTLDCPESEDFAGIDQLIFVSQFFADR